MFITPTTSALTRKVKLEAGQALQVRGSLSAEESITLEIPDGAGGWKQLVEMVSGASTQITLNSSNDTYAPNNSVYLRINKPVTVANVGVDKLK